jgi:hypothetical protein
MTGHAHAQAEPGVTVAPLYTLAEHVIANRGVLGDDDEDEQACLICSL